jgi:hypothetical protein
MFCITLAIGCNGQLAFREQHCSVSTQTIILLSRFSFERKNDARAALELHVVVHLAKGFSRTVAL